MARKSCGNDQYGMQVSSGVQWSISSASASHVILLAETINNMYKRRGDSPTLAVMQPVGRIEARMCQLARSLHSEPLYVVRRG